MICWVLAMEMLQGVWKQHLRPRAVVGYGVKISLPSPPNYVTRSPGSQVWTRLNRASRTCNCTREIHVCPQDIVKKKKEIKLEEKKQNKKRRDANNSKKKKGQTNVWCHAFAPLVWNVAYKDAKSESEVNLSQIIGPQEGWSNIQG